MRLRSLVCLLSSLYLGCKCVCICVGICVYIYNSCVVVSMVWVVMIINF